MDTRGQVLIQIQNMAKKKKAKKTKRFGSGKRTPISYRMPGGVPSEPKTSTDII